MVYAIVKASGRQEKVSVGDVLVLDRQSGAPGDVIELPAVLLVDGTKVTSKVDDLAKVKVKAEIVGNERGKKIDIQIFKNKSGYVRRKGHRQDLTRVQITSIK